VADEERIAELAKFAESYPDDALGVEKALVSLERIRRASRSPAPFFFRRTQVATPGRSTTSVSCAGHSDAKPLISSFPRSP